MIIQAIALSDQLDKDVNTFAMRVREWFVPFPSSPSRSQPSRAHVALPFSNTPSPAGLYVSRHLPSISLPSHPVAFGFI